MRPTYRQGSHSPINIWCERDGEPDVQVAMAITDHKAAELVRLANLGAALRPLADALLAAWDGADNDDAHHLVAAVAPHVEALRPEHGEDTP